MNTNLNDNIGSLEESTERMEIEIESLKAQLAKERFHE